jgi:hypothetical protein
MIKHTKAVYTVDRTTLLASVGDVVLYIISFLIITIYSHAFSSGNSVVSSVRHDATFS